MRPHSELEQRTADRELRLADVRTAPVNQTRAQTPLRLFDRLAEMGHEQVMLCSDPESGYRGIIAIHDTTLGRALGGTRFWPYASDEEALTDVLRLSRGMTYKSAVAGLNLGGGKAVIIGDHKTANREPIFRAHGRFVNTLGGLYVTAEDVGTSPADMDHVARETRHVAGLAHRSGDPSPVTAHGVFRAILASARTRWGSDDISGRTVAVQGCGHVGRYLSNELREAGANLIVTDIERDRVQRVVHETGAKAVDPDGIYDIEADIFAPCALGGILNDDTIPRLRVEVVAGGANNQLLDERHGVALEERGILYAPDYVANAGGVINVFGELEGWDQQRALEKADDIYETVLTVFSIAAADKVPPHEAADRLAERRLREAHERKAAQR